jgi:SAM-dependent methyltransferase
MTSTPDRRLLEIRKLAPWHHQIELDGGIHTAMAQDEVAGGDQRPVSMINEQKNFHQLIERLYPEGFIGKRFLDCACNAGGYCFWAAEKGASHCLGFDARDHWIRQAEFCKAQRKQFPVKGIRFKVCDLYDLPTLKSSRVDLCLFKGIFYHLPDPIRGLQLAADLTDGFLILNTQTAWGCEDGMLRPRMEDTRSVMSGVHGLNWQPTGSKTFVPVLKWLGFKEAIEVFHRQNPKQPDLGRMEIIASRKTGLLDLRPGEKWLFRPIKGA